MIKMIRKGIMYLILLAFSLSFVISGVENPIFLNVMDNHWFYLTENQPFQFFIEAFDSEAEYPLDFYATEGSQLFPSFRIINYNDTFALMNFTPRNYDVGNSNGPRNYTAYIIAEDTSGGYSTVRLYFNIQNVNDKPNITGMSPSMNIFIEENITQRFMFDYYLSDIDIPWGDSLRSTWIFNEEIIYNTSDTSGIYDHYFGFCTAGINNITLFVTDIENETDYYSWNVNTLNINRAPVFSGVIGNITWNEGETLHNNISLRDYFFDLDEVECEGEQKDNLSFSAIGNSRITIEINQTTGNVTFIPEDYWYGIETISFIANDSMNITYSNQIRLSIINVENPPIINEINISPIAVGTHFSFDLSEYVYDYDGDQLIYNSNSSVFMINETTGIMTAYPLISDIHEINLSVYDGLFNVSSIFFIEVIPNNIPVINFIENRTGTEGIEFVIPVQATDADLEDQLIFSINSSWFTKSVLDNSSGSAAARFIMTPTDNQTGNFSFLVSVNDTKGAMASQVVYVYIEDINNPPEWSVIPIQRPRVNYSYFLNLFDYVSDNDANDILSFDINDSRISLNKETGIISFFPNETEYIIANVSANDSFVISYTEIIFDIKVNTPPSIQDNFTFNCTEKIECIIIIPAGDVDDDFLSFNGNFSADFSNITISNQDKHTGRINFIPEQRHTGYNEFIISVNDPYDGINHTLLILNITDINDPPFFTNISNMTLIEGTTYFIYLESYDEDGDNVSYYHDSHLFGNIPLFSHEGTRSLGRIIFTPSHDDVGEYNITFNVTDGINMTFETVFWRILDIDNPPNITAFSPEWNASILEGVLTVFNVNFTDPDSTEFTYIWKQDNSLITTNDENNWDFIPSFCSAGFSIINFTVFDDTNLSDTQIWNLTIDNNNRIPIYNKTIEDIVIRKNEVKDLFFLDNFFYDLDSIECQGSNKDILLFNYIGGDHTSFSIDPLTSEVTIVPETNFVGVDTVRFYANDSFHQTYSGIININITANEKPVIETIYPYGALFNGSYMLIELSFNTSFGSSTIIDISEGSKIFFNQTSSDPDSDTLSYSWFKNGILKDNGLYHYEFFNFSSSGEHNLTLEITDGVEIDSFEWLLRVSDINQKPVFGEKYYSEPFGFNTGTYLGTYSDSRGILRSNQSNSRYISPVIDFETLYNKPRLSTISWSLIKGASDIVINSDANISASSNPLLIENLRDNNPASSWLGTTNSEWILIDFGIEVGITNITIDIANQVSYNISIADSYGNFSLVHGQTNAIGIMKTTYSDALAQYVLFNFSGNPIEINEINILGEPVVFAKIRTSENGIQWTNWTDRITNNGMLPQEEEVQNRTHKWKTRFVQYLVDFYELSADSFSSIENLTINYEIADFSLEENYNSDNWIDLDHYFSDYDGDLIEYNITYLENAENLGLIIDEDNIVSIDPETDWNGVARFRFSASDNKSEIVYSNNITITVVDVPNLPNPQIGGGGGSSTITKVITVPYEVEKNVTQMQFLQILSSEPLIMTNEHTVIAPITVFNGGNQTLFDLEIDAVINGNNDANLTFKDKFIPMLFPGDIFKTDITAITRGKLKPYQINVSVSSKNPELRDSTLISITPLPIENLNETVRFVRDLLESNPECLELNEHIQQAIKELENDQVGNAKEILEKTIEACRYLITNKEKFNKEYPMNMITGKMTFDNFVHKNKVPLTIIGLILIILVVILVAIIIATANYNHKIMKD